MSASATATPQNKTQEWVNRLRANPKIPLMVASAAAVAILVAMVLWAKARTTARCLATCLTRMAALSLAN